MLGIKYDTCPCIFGFALRSSRSSVTVNKIINLANKYNPKEIIFVGDTFDLYINKNNIKYLKQLEDKLSKYKLIFLKGNHDNLLPLEKYELELDNHKFIFFHGHQYANEPNFLAKIGSKINNYIYKLLKIDLQSIFRKLLMKQYEEGKYYPEYYKSKQKIIKDYEKTNYNRIVVGHTHKAEVDYLENMVYINLGDWNYYGIILSDGDMNLLLLE